MTDAPRGYYAAYEKNGQWLVGLCWLSAKTPGKWLGPAEIYCHRYASEKEAQKVARRLTRQRPSEYRVTP